MCKSAIAGSYGKYIFSFTRNARLFQSGYSSLHFHQQCMWSRSSLFSTNTSSCYHCFFLRRGHSDWCVMVSHCDVNLHFPNSRGVEQPLLSVSALSWNVFSCLLSIFYLDCLDFYCWVLRFLYCICEFFFKYVVLDIFSHFVAWFFIPFTWSFEHWKF